MKERQDGRGGAPKPVSKRSRGLDRHGSGRSPVDDGQPVRKERRRDPDEVVWDWEDNDTDDELAGYDLDFVDDLELEDEADDEADDEI